MFNVVRSYPGPASLSRNVSYKDADVIDALRSMFFDKCYLCEQASLSNPEVEHFVPHGDTNALKFGWGNLYYACRRCNGIKSNSHINLLDCTVAGTNVSDEIVHFAGNAEVGEIVVRAASANPSQQTINTVKLLNKCFNGENTALRKVSKESLMEKLLVELNNFRPLRDVLAQRLSPPADILNSKQSLAIMCRSDYPFSVFWRWHLMNDIIVRKNHSNLRAELGF